MRSIRFGGTLRSLLLLLCAFVARSAFSQPPSNQLNQFGAIQNFGVDSIDLTSLTVRFSPTLLHKAGRGQNLDLKMTYAADSVLSSQFYGWTPILQGLIGKVSYSVAGCSHAGCGYDNWQYTDQYGTLHYFAGALVAVGSKGDTVTSGYAVDGTGLELTPGNPATITGPTGASWKVPSAQTGELFTPGGFREDSNGNLISETSTTISDTLGATIQVANYTQIGQEESAPPSETYTYYDSTGTSHTITVNTALYQITSSFPATPCWENYEHSAVIDAQFDLPTSIALPNGTAYTFSYETVSDPAGSTTGRISQITLPTGGSISYTYPSASSLVQGDQQNCLDNGVFFLTRTTADGPWTYTRTLSNYGYAACDSAGDCSSYPPPIATTTVVDPEGNTTVYTFMYYYLFGYGNYTYLQTSMAVYQGGATGTPLLFQQTCYNGFSPPCASENYVNLPNVSTDIISTKDVYTSYNGGSPSRTTTKYNNPLYVPIEVDEYDFGATTPTRKTFTAYYSINGIQSNKPSSIIVKDGQNNVLKQTLYGYDETAVLPSTTSSSTHAAVTGQRGNLTSESDWLNTANTWLKTKYTNDDTGNRLTETDPKGDPATQYVYTDSWYSNASLCALTTTNAFLTSITDSLGHQSTRSYDACTGLMRQERDPNDIANARQGTITSYDEMNAVVGITYPDGGSTSTNYGGYAVPFTITTTTAASPDPSVATTTVLDGYGRVSKSIESDPSGGDETDTAYNMDGLVYSVTNPYRSTPDATNGTRYLYYDAMGRKIQEKAPDGTSEIWGYNGSTVTFYDENNNQWARTSDGLGRLIKVLEPSGVSALPSLETDYSYDGNDNILSVTQWGGVYGSTGGRSRSFNYDSLSRLLCASNPENSAASCPAAASPSYIPRTTGYSYDANSNMATKTDARGITTQYQYDALNRILSKLYLNDASSTPSSCYQYDLSSIPNGVGRLSNQWTQSASAGACPTSPPAARLWTRRSVSAYDAMGRVQSEQQCTPSTCNSNTPYTPAYTYDLAGNLTSLTNGISSTPGAPTEPLTLTNTYDSAGHLSALTSNWSDSTHPVTLFAAQTATTTPCANSSTAPYAPFGGLWNATYGNGLNLNRAYDKRLRTTCELDMGSTIGTQTFGSASVTITGSEQQK